jgi:hypothetical protein
MTISIDEIKGKMSKLPIIYNNVIMNDATSDLHKQITHKNNKLYSH